MSSRCKACDEPMSAYEMTRRSLVTTEYIELCNTCLVSVGLGDVFVMDRPDLKHLTDDLYLVEEVYEHENSELTIYDDEPEDFYDS